MTPTRTPPARRTDNTTAGRADALTAYKWEPQPEAERLVRDLVGGFLAGCPFAKDLAARMAAETGTRFHDWIDHIAVRPSAELRRRLASAGYGERSANQFKHPGGVFPPILLCEALEMEVALKVESVTDFVVANGTDPDGMCGHPLDVTRWAVVSPPDDLFLSVVERHGAAAGEAAPQTNVSASWHA